MSDPVKRLIDLAGDVVSRAKKSGADIAEALAREGSELSVRVRMGEPELVEEAAPRAVGLRVIAGGRSATAYTSDTTSAGLASLVSDAIELAQLSQPDEMSLPPDPSLLAKGDLPDLDLFDPSGGTVGAHAAIKLAVEAEAAALGHDPRITNSEGATFSRDISARALVTSGGFAGGYRSSSYSLVVNPVASGGEGKMQVGHYWDSRRFFSALESPEQIGVEAGRRTLAKLGAQKVPTCEVPVIFDPDAGRGLLSLLFSCISGHAIFRKSSYLVDREGQIIASPLVTIVDDPLIPRGPGSRPYDGEGLPSRRNTVVSQGKLQTFLLDTYSARKLGKESTASAARGVGGTPSVSPSNFQLVAGSSTPEEILAGVGEGLYVTSMMGFGFNPVTGDFSRGAEGFWVEKGRKVKPVGEITISLGFDQLWKTIDAVGNDLLEKTAYAAPTFRVRKMTIAGS